MNLNINNLDTTNYTSIAAYTVPSQNLEGADGQEEKTYQNTKFSQQWGYFNNVPELKNAIIMFAILECGKGYTTDTVTDVDLDHISGWGKDSFKEILFNMRIMARVAGDAYCEIIRDPETGTLLNLKPLDPSSMRIVVDKKGLILRYEQVNKITNNTIKFKPEEIWHMSHDRLGDQIHGISVIDALEKTILADEANFDDMVKVSHNQAVPLLMWKLGTDDTAKIAQFKSKLTEAKKWREDLIIPDDDQAVKWEVVQVNLSSLIMEWRNALRTRFYRAIGLPQLFTDSQDASESSGKIGYLIFENIIEKFQRQIEESIWNQLYLRIDLIPPATLQESLNADNTKDGAGALGFQPSDTTAGVGR